MSPRFGMGLGAVLLLASAIALASPRQTAAESPLPTPTAKGICRFEPFAEQTNIPESFRLAPHEFPWELRELPDFPARFSVSYVTFPSPVTTPVEVNNTVHCEYFRPTHGAQAKMPAVVVLHILGGDFELCRLFCNGLAQKGSAALLVKMPYYGPRRDPKVPRRMISANPEETIEGMTQAVLDIRRAAAWLADRPEIDPQRIGVFGISLGGITSGLVMMLEPRFTSGCMLLAGGDIPQLLKDYPGSAQMRKLAAARGIDPEKLAPVLQKIDPATYAANRNGRPILMLNAKNDEIIPKVCTIGLWEKWGKPEIVWYPGGHYTATLSIFDALHRTTQFFTALPAKTP